MAGSSGHWCLGHIALRTHGSLEAFRRHHLLSQRSVLRRELKETRFEIIAKDDAAVLKVNGPIQVDEALSDVNLARAIDEKVYADLNEGDVLAWIREFGLEQIIEKVLRETASAKIEGALKRLFETEAPKLYPEFKRHFDLAGVGLLEKLRLGPGGLHR